MMYSDTRYIKSYIHKYSFVNLILPKFVEKKIYAMNISIIWGLRVHNIPP